MAFFLVSFNGDDNLNISIFSVKSEGPRTIRFRMGHNTSSKKYKIS